MKAYFVSKKAVEWARTNDRTRLLNDLDNFIADYKDATKKAGYYDSIPASKIEAMMATAQKRLEKLNKVLYSKKVSV